jgi:hypothetical protein
VREVTGVSSDFSQDFSDPETIQMPPALVELQAVRVAELDATSFKPEQAPFALQSNTCAYSDGTLLRICTNVCETQERPNLEIRVSASHAAALAAGCAGMLTMSTTSGLQGTDASADSVCISPDGELIAVACGKAVSAYQYVRATRAWQSISDVALEGQARSLCWHPSLPILAAASQSELVLLAVTSDAKPSLEQVAHFKPLQPCNSSIVRSSWVSNEARGSVEDSSKQLNSISTAGSSSNCSTLLVVWGSNAELFVWRHSSDASCQDPQVWLSPERRRILLGAAAASIRALVTGPPGTVLCTLDAPVIFSKPQAGLLDSSVSEDAGSETGDTEQSAEGPIDLTNRALAGADSRGGVLHHGAGFGSADASGVAARLLQGAQEAERVGAPPARLLMTWVRGAGGSQGRSEEGASNAGVITTPGSQVQQPAVGKSSNRSTSHQEVGTATEVSLLMPRPDLLALTSLTHSHSASHSPGIHESAAAPSSSLASSTYPWVGIAAVASTAAPAIVQLVQISSTTGLVPLRVVALHSTPPAVPPTSSRLRGLGLHWNPHQQALTLHGLHGVLSSTQGGSTTPGSGTAAPAAAAPPPPFFTSLSKSGGVRATQLDQVQWLSARVPTSILRDTLNLLPKPAAASAPSASSQSSTTPPAAASQPGSTHGAAPAASQGAGVGAAPADPAGALTSLLQGLQAHLDRRLDGLGAMIEDHGRRLTALEQQQQQQPKP